MGQGVVCTATLCPFRFCPSPYLSCCALSVYRKASYAAAMQTVKALPGKSESFSKVKFVGGHSFDSRIHRTHCRYLDEQLVLIDGELILKLRLSSNAPVGSYTFLCACLQAKRSLLLPTLRLESAWAKAVTCFVFQAPHTWSKLTPYVAAPCRRAHRCICVIFGGLSSLLLCRYEYSCIGV